MGSEFSRDELIKGIWDDDLDEHPENKYEFISKSGYKCEIRRGNSWTYCGYVTLPKGHPFFHKKYHKIEKIINVHGDLTYGRGDGKFGFDCHHILMGDVSPLDETMKVKHPDKFPFIDDDIFFFKSQPHYGNIFYFFPCLIAQVFIKKRDLKVGNLKMNGVICLQNINMGTQVILFLPWKE